MIMHEIGMAEIFSHVSDEGTRISQVNEVTGSQGAAKQTRVGTDSPL